jgi:pimeloyl-ACP methyl ester carboxylesterase
VGGSTGRSRETFISLAVHEPDVTVELHGVEIPNGETIAYRRREGGDVPVVLVHGNMSSSKHYDVLIDALADRYAVYAPDLRGFGESSYEEPIDSLAEFSEDLEQWVEAADVETPFHLVGWSTGGGVATVYAAKNPGNVRRMALISPVSTRGFSLYRKDEAGQPIPGELLTTREEIANDPVQVAPVLQAQENDDVDTMQTIWNQTIYVHDRPPQPKYDEEYGPDLVTQRNLVDVDYALVHFNVSGEDNGVEPGTGQAAEVEAPTLVLRGEDDLVISGDDVEQVVEDLGGPTDLVEVPECGHSPLVDALGTLVGEIEAHFEDERE